MNRRGAGTVAIFTNQFIALCGGTVTPLAGPQSEQLVSLFWVLDAERNLVGDADAVAFEGHDFFRVIGENANIFQAEVDQDLCADTAFVLYQALARG